MPPPDRPPRPPVERFGTLIESEDEIRQAIAANLGGRPAAPSAPQSAAPSPTAPEAVPPVASAKPFRPTARPPVAVLTVFDDGRSDGETIRIRTPKFVIGRAEGDLTIPIDGRISSRHVEIALQPVNGAPRWVVTDLQSRHGLFVRVSRAALSDGAEFLVGGGRYQFQAPTSPDAGETRDHPAGGPAGDFGHTQPWADGGPTVGLPTLVELVQEGPAGRTPLIKPEYWIGAAASCEIRRVDDPFCEPRHARMTRGANGGWGVEHDRTANGLWVRMARIVVDAPVRFQIGEQRFQIKVM